MKEEARLSEAAMPGGIETARSSRGVPDGEVRHAAPVTRVFVVAASEVVRAGLNSLMGSSHTSVLAGSAETIAVAADAESEADVYLVDADPLDARALEELEGARVVVLAADPEAFRGAAQGVLPRSASAAQIVAAVEAVAAGLIVLDAALADSNREGLRVRETAEPATALSARELEVLRMLASGLANKEIAWRMQISEHTVKFHISSIFQKLKVSSRTEAVTMGMRMGLVML
jgi:two-component system, NarL family, response regulator YdfI